MPVTALDREVLAFAVELFERSGGVADWPVPEESGNVVVPPELAAAADLPGEDFALALRPSPDTLHVGVGGEFLDIAARVLDIAVPKDGSFVIPDRYLTRGNLGEKVTQAFVWQNARAVYLEPASTDVEYHFWSLHGSLRSEDLWEGMFSIAVNSISQAIVQLPDILDEADLIGEPSSAPAPGVDTYRTAVAEGRRQLIHASTAFVARIEQRLERDQKRLRDYYRALSRETSSTRRRVQAAPTPDETAARKRAIDLELRRKLADLNDQYAISAELRPITLARVRVPALLVPVRIQRKQAVREYGIYWNSLTKKLEPLACSRCRRPTFSATFTNDTVDLLCAECG